MRKVSGLWISVESARADRVAASIERHDQFSMTVTSSEVRPRAVELAVVWVPGQMLDSLHVGVSQAGPRVGTDETKITVSSFVSLGRLSPSDIKSKLPARFAVRFDPPRMGVDRPPPRLWEEILNAIASTRPDVQRELALLNGLVEDSRIPRRRVDGGLEVFERDAVAVVLQTWGGTSLRKKVLRRAATRQGTAAAPFLSRLRSPVREDLLIAHDHATFPGMDVAWRDVRGSVELAAGEERLTILNCNRQPLEQTLGVDLIYYSHSYDSFVLVQYKRMSGGSSGVPEYRPEGDRSHVKELDRMISADNMLTDLKEPNAGGIAAFRLSRQSFFVKLCEAKMRPMLDASMVSGMYVPLGLWQRLLESGSARGPRGGIRITWETCRRRLSNSEFINLVRHGWIGSAEAQSRVLSEIIKGVLDGGRMLIYAATSSARGTRDLRRDGLGRFAADDDPAGAF
jgi:hypothetical protein